MNVKPDLSSERILVVDDDYMSVSELVRGLHSMGVHVIGPAADVKTAMKFLVEHEISGAILDINLGGEMVFPLADELERRALPFIFATGYERDVVPARHLDKVFLQKPLDSDTVASALRGFQPTPVSEIDIRKNAILALLPQTELEIILPKLEAVKLSRALVVEHQEKDVALVYFPTTCIISIIVIAHDGKLIESGIVGREGCTGFGLVCGDNKSAFKLVNQIEGSALKMSASDCVAAFATCPSLRKVTLAFSRALSIQVAHTALVNGRFDLPHRLARWVLMVGDRLEAPVFPVTHEYLSVMLGVRRSGVTNALHILEGQNLIKSRRNQVIILDRPGLERFAGGSYGEPEREYQRLVVR